MLGRIKLDVGDWLHVEETHDYRYLPMVTCDDGTEWYVAESHEHAGQKAREYWEDLAKDDPSEFACLVGENTLVAWALGQPAGPGSTQVCSLEEWLDLWLETPEEEFASYDGNEYEVTSKCGRVADELGFTPRVAYRHN